MKACAGYFVPAAPIAAATWCAIYFVGRFTKFWTVWPSCRRYSDVAARCEVSS